MAFACNYLDIMGTGKLAKLIQLMSKVVLLYSYDVDCFKLADNLFIFYFVIFGFLSLCEVANDKPQHFVFVSVLEIQQQISHQSYKLEKLGIMVSLVGGHPLYTQQKDWQSYPCLYYAHKRFSVGESQPFVLNVFIVSLAFLSWTHQANDSPAWALFNHWIFEQKGVQLVRILSIFNTIFGYLRSWRTNVFFIDYYILVWALIQRRVFLDFEEYCVKHEDLRGWYEDYVALL